jgi:WD40 repeat protein
VLFSPQGQWIAGLEPDGGIYLYRLTDGPPEQPRSLLTGVLDGISESLFVFSRDEQWAAASTSQGVYAWSMRMQPPHKLQPMLVCENVSPSVMAFSTDNHWLVFRASFDNFYAWKVTDPPSGQASAFMDLSKSSSDVSIPISFSKDGKWGGGIAQDKGVYVWSSTMFPNQPPANFIPAEGGSSHRMPAVRFSPKGDFVAGRGTGGSVYVWKVESHPDLTKPAAHYDASEIVFVFTADGQHLFSAGGNSLDWGELGQPLQPILRSNYEIHGIAMKPQGEALIVFGTRHLIIVQRKAYFWGIPLWTRPWPLLEEEE